MKIIVAGAGAGKTTSMAKLVLDRFSEITDGKIIYVITYTNAARDRIRQLVIEKNGCIPKQIQIETSHVFLLREVIFPFHHLLYGQQFTKTSHIKLSNNQGYKALKIKELESNKLVHVERVTEIAKWILCKKSSDNREIKDKRKKILGIVSHYLDSVFIDEAQDMDEHLADIIKLLNDKGINMFLIGDPKQDLRGRNAFKEMIRAYIQFVEYRPENKRCPNSHVELANKYVSEEEFQVSISNEAGYLGYVFESDIDSSFISNLDWDQIYIYKKNQRFLTHADDRKFLEHNLSYELRLIVKRVVSNENEVDKWVYTAKKDILLNLEKKNNYGIFRLLEELHNIDLTNRDKGRLGEVLDQAREISTSQGLLVNSIDSIKGLEGNRCLFILTTDLAAYLFEEKKDQNKMMSYLYVTLTRAKQTLTFLVALEVEEKYNRSAIVEMFDKLNVKS